MRSFIKKLWSAVTHVQVLAVFFAFAMMVFLSYNYMSDIERKHLLGNVDNAISDTQDKINAELLKSELILTIVSETIRGMTIEINNFEMIQEYVRYIYNDLMADTRLQTHIVNICGIFEIYGDRFFDGSGKITANDFDVNESLWYSKAVKAGGEIIWTEPVIDKENNIVIISFARRIFNDNNDPLGVICLDVNIDEIRKFAAATSVTDSSYGILFDKNFNVIAHPSCFNDNIKFKYLGGNLSKMNDGQAIVDLLKKGSNISERKVWDYNRNESVGFFQWLDNGWCLAVIAYADKYYQSLKNIGYILCVLGVFFALSLSAILLNVVTGKKNAEERTQIMLDATPLCANFWDNNLNLIDCNKEAVKLFELSSKKEYLEQYKDLSPEYQPDGNLSREKSAEYVKKAFAEGYCRYEWTYRKLGGDMIPCEITLVRVNFRNEYMVCGYIRDLRALKAITAKMREADECTQILFDATPLSCFMLDKFSNVVETNQEIVRLFGLSNKKEFISQFENISPQYQPTGQQSDEILQKYIDEAFEDGFCRFEWMHQRLDGEQIPTEVSFVRVKFRGEYAIAAYIRDLREVKNMIAEMRRAEVAEESNKAKSDFLAKMSHEIRTPMNAIMGITEIQLQDHSLSLATKEALERIYNSGDLLLGIINDILDLSKIEAGKLELTTAQYDIASLIFDTVKLNIMRYESKPIDFRLDVNENTPLTLLGDELRIKQILNNLLSNAFKYTQDGQIEFSLSAEMQSSDSKCLLVFRVSDTGQGMTADQVRKLGDKFSRFNMDANRKTEGTGLGMNITRNLIQLMNGDIVVESTPGLGSVFTVRLPQMCAGSEPIGRELADNLMKLNLKNTIKMRNAQITQEYMPYGRVLVIDDVETNLYVARGLIAPYGISIDTGLSGFEAIEKIRDGAVYDIIFMDHMMPRMDGIEAVKIIRGLGYSGPIVALTANALSGQAEMFINNGFDDFISKPIDIRQLNNVLNKLIRDKQSSETITEARKQKNVLYAAGSHNIAVDPQLAEFFIRDAKKAVSVLTAISENRCRRLDDVSAFLINVHAMKSALANVGESELAEESAKLEQAGRDQNINLILLALPDYIEELKTTIEKFRPEDDNINEEDDPASDDIDYLMEKLREIQNACGTFNKKAAKEALADLKQKSWARSIRDQLSIIAKHLLHTEFDEVASVARQMMDWERH